MKKIRSLLIVDDNQLDVLLTRKVLERTGAFEHVYAVTDGAEALDLFRDYQASCEQYPGMFPPMVVLLDINMPLMNGFEFLEQLEAFDAEHADTSVVVMLTSSSYNEDRRRAMKYHTVKHYLVKPMNKASAADLLERFGVEAS